MNEAQNLLTIGMAAKYLHCHPETVRRMIRRGELKAVKFRKFWRVPMEGLKNAGNADSITPAIDHKAERLASLAKLRELADGTREGLPPISDESLTSENLYAGRGE